MLRKMRLRANLALNGLSSTLKEAPYEVAIGNKSLELYSSPFNCKWFTELNVHPNVILDLGTFDGGDAYRFSESFPECRVVSVEADPVRYEAVMSGMSETRIEFLNLAICETDGTVDWFQAKIDGEVHGQGSLYRHTESYTAAFSFVNQVEEAIEVKGTRLDSLCDSLKISQIDLLHMDIEGAENAAIRSLGGIRPRLIFSEMCQDRFIGVDSTQATHRLLQDLGYKMIVNLGADRLYKHIG